MKQPPRIAERILSALLPHQIRDAMLADLADAYAEPSRMHRKRWYWAQVARAAWPPTLIALHRQQTFDEGRMMPESAPLAEIIMYDSRLALRGFRRRPFFTAMIVTTMALGVGANATMFGIIDRMLFSAPPHIVDPDRVALLAFGTRESNYSQISQPYAVKTVIERSLPATLK